MPHEFVIAFAPITPEQFDAIVESLGVSCNDATFSLQGEIMSIQFDREADTLRDAINSAFNDLCDSEAFMDTDATMAGMKTPLFPPPHFVTPDEAAQMFCHHFASMRYGAEFDDAADEFAELIEPGTYTREQIRRHLRRHDSNMDAAATTTIAREAPTS